MTTTTTWPSDAELDDAATRVADKLFQMMTEAGAWSQPPIYGPDGQHHPQVSEQEGFRGAVYQHSDQFKILDPAKIGEEFTRMKDAANSTGQDSEAIATLRSAQASLSSTWHGDAAKAFALQMTHIETFMLKQEHYILNAMQRVGALFGMAALTRKSYLELVETTIAACEHELQEQAKRDTALMVNLAMDVVSFGIGLFSGESEEKVIVGLTLDGFADGFKDAASYVIAGNGARDVLNNYNKAFGDMCQSNTEALARLRQEFDQGTADMAQDQLPLLTPLDPVTDVTSPKFGYLEFFSSDQTSSAFEQKVASEQKKVLRPEGSDSPIRRRLDTAQ